MVKLIVCAENLASDANDFVRLATALAEKNRKEREKKAGTGFWNKNNAVTTGQFNKIYMYIIIIIIYAKAML